ncbi:MAG: phage tail tape measure protein [Oscillospiraceae bacterium]|nr:phage tail tape measure protein [Oscillospiraceae bacterium]
MNPEIDFENLKQVKGSDIRKAAAGQSNIPKEELLDFAESAAKMGIAFDAGAEEAGQMMAQWRTAI